MLTVKSIRNTFRDLREGRERVKKVGGKKVSTSR